MLCINNCNLFTPSKMVEFKHVQPFNLISPCICCLLNASILQPICFVWYNILPFWEEFIGNWSFPNSKAFLLILKYQICSYPLKALWLSKFWSWMSKHWKFTPLLYLDFLWKRLFSGLNCHLFQILNTKTRQSKL